MIKGDNEQADALLHSSVWQSSPHTIMIICLLTDIWYGSLDCLASFRALYRHFVYKLMQMSLELPLNWNRLGRRRRGIPLSLSLMLLIWWWCNAVSKSTDAKLNLNWHFDNDNKDDGEKESEEKEFSAQAIHAHYYRRNTTFPHRTDAALPKRTYAAYRRYLHKLYQFSFLPASYSWTKVVRFSRARQNEILAKPMATIRTTDRFTSH